MEETNNKKTVVIIIAVVILIIVGFGGAIWGWYSNLEAYEQPTPQEQSIKLSVQEYTLEIGNQLPQLENFLLKAEDKDIVKIDSSNLDTSKLGEYLVTFSYEAMNIPYYAEMIINVVDTTAPKIEVKNLVIDKGTSIDIMQFITEYFDYTDVTFTYIAEPNINKVGTQKISIRAVDESGNETIKDVTLTINEVIVVSDDTPSSNEPNNNNYGSSSNEADESNNNNSNNQSSPNVVEPTTNGVGATFHIDDYNSFDEANNACKSERKRQQNNGVYQTGECNPFKENGVNKGYKLTWY